MDYRAALYHVNSSEAELPSEIVNEFSSFWKAWLYKFFRYHLGAEPAWKFSFSWEIREASGASSLDTGREILKERQESQGRRSSQSCMKQTQGGLGIATLPVVPVPGASCQSDTAACFNILARYPPGVI